MLKLMAPGAGAIRPLTTGSHEAWTRYVKRAGYLTEPWRCDVGSGTFVLGPEISTLLGLRHKTCGIVDLVRAYDKDDRATILNILEKATANSSSFCFSAIVSRSGGGSAQVFCIGKSTLADDGREGTLQGIFAVPTLCA